jgi:RNA-directed DNA polymerase
LELELHPQKSRIIPLSQGVDFVGFRNFYHFRLLRKRNIRNMEKKIMKFEKGETSFRKLTESYQGWQAYARWANTYKLRKGIKNKIIDAVWERV